MSLEMKLKEELAVDLGGVSKDIVSGFWQEAYERLFDGSISFVSAVHPHIEFSLFEVLGEILSHGYFCTGFLPTQISFPTLATMILGCQVQISPYILLEPLFDYFSDEDRSVLSTALQFSKDNPNMKFPSQILDSLLNVFCHFQCLRVPDPLSLGLTLVDIDCFVFLTNPMSAINAVNLAIPQSHVPFWKSMSSDLYKLYLALTATPFKVLSLLAERTFFNASQETVFGYLQQFIENITKDQVKMFLQFCMQY
uniref:HECT domain-containing protein n=1 Tax=Amphimedon queenslandica TaxID=400682 RepID=A0A1X7TQY9_AMPQE